MPAKMRLIREVIYKVRQFFRRFVSPVSLGCRALVVKDGQVLLVKHSYQDGWYLPGGAVDKGEALPVAVVRELAEECAISVKVPILKHMFFSEFERRSDHIAFFVIDDFEPISGAKPDGEIAELGFFRLDQLPEGASKATRRRVAEFTSGAALPERW